MTCSCHGSCASATAAPADVDPRWKRALWIALIVNAGMFLAEIVAGVVAGSSALQADALDFLGDAVNYAVAVWVAGMALAWRARAAMVKGLGLIGLGVWVGGTAVWHVMTGTVPRAEVMGVVGVTAFLANAGVAVMLWRFRDGDANMRSVWICSRNDAIGNLAVLAAALGVFGTGAGWPDAIVAAIMASLSVSGGIEIVRHARDDLGRAGASAIPVAGE